MRMARDPATPLEIWLPGALRSRSKAFLLLAVALIGTTITPYMQFYLASAVVDKGVTPKTYKDERIDTINGAILSDVVPISSSSPPRPRSAAPDR